MFDLSYRISESEFVEAHRFHLRTSLLTFKNSVFVLIAVLIGTAQLRLFGGGTDWVLAVFFGIWALVLGFLAYVYFRFPARLYHRDSKHSELQRMKIDRDGIKWVTKGSESQQGWQSVTRISESPSCLLLHAGHGLPMVIPRSAFRSSEEYWKAREYILGKMTGQ